MRRVAWRPVLLAFCAFTALVQIASLLDEAGMGGAPPWWGRLGATIVSSSESYRFSVRLIDPGGPADRAGLRKGDQIDARALTLHDRMAFSLFFAQAHSNGRPVVLAVQRGSLHELLTVVPEPLSPGRYWSAYSGALGSLWLLLFAALIAWRRSDLPAVRLLSLWLTTFVLSGAVSGFAAPWAWALILFTFASIIVTPLSVALLAALAGSFARPLSRPRLFAERACYAIVAIWIALAIAGILGTITLWFDPFRLYALGGLAWGAATLLAVLCGVLAAVASRGVERQRAVWTLVPLALIYCSFIAYGIAVPASSSFTAAALWNLGMNLTILAAPLALTYAALSRRLIDAGFVLNRAVVFTIVSTIVIGAFVLVEWAAREWLVSTGHTVSTVIGMGLALGLGLSMRYIHRHVDRFVDRVFFRKRHDDEAALRRFAHEASYITDSSILLERAVREVKEHTNADASIVVANGAAAFASAAETNGPRTIAGENDPAILALRAWRKPIDLASVEDSALRGEFAFPMFSRGTLVGVLVCGAKPNGEAYAPDESEALLALAHGVGAALDVLSVQRDRPNELVLSKLHELHDDVKRAQLGELLLRKLDELQADMKRMPRA